MLKALREGDVCVAVRIDRLARSLRSPLIIAEKIREKGAHLKFLDQSIDTKTPAGELVFNILGSLAEFELSLIKSRTIDGLERAKAQGKRLGKAPSTARMLTARLRHDGKQEKAGIKLLKTTESVDKRFIGGSRNGVKSKRRKSLKTRLFKNINNLRF